MALHFSREEFSKRKQDVLKSMKEQNLDALLMFRQESMYWLTGYDTFGYVFFQTLVLDQKGNIVLLTRAPDLRQAQNTSNIQDIRIWVDKDGINPTDDLKIILEELDLKNKNIGIEYEAYGMTGRNALRLNKTLNNYCEIQDQSELITKLRVIKSKEEITYIKSCFSKINIPATKIGKLNDEQWIKITNKTEIIYSKKLFELKKDWSETSYQIQARRGNSNCAKQEHDELLSDNPGLQTKISFDINQNIVAPFINQNIKPRVAILRDQGVNGHIEMAAAFDRAEFDSVDIHMSDLVNGRLDLKSFKGLVACGGFSYGDVLGAGEGWAKSILFNSQLKDIFQNFFHQKDVFSLGICNGCQMLANLKSLIPGAENWPKFVRNSSEEFEARFSLVKTAPI